MFYDPVELTRDDKEIRLWARFETQQASLILGFIAENYARYMKKTPEEVEALRRARKENWLRRKGGKLPPSALDAPGKADAPPATGADPSEPAAPQP